jgi:hypothetical protein
MTSYVTDVPTDRVDGCLRWNHHRSMSQPPLAEALHGVRFFIVTRKFVLEADLTDVCADGTIRAWVHAGYSAGIKGPGWRDGGQRAPWKTPLAMVRLAEQDARDLFTEIEGHEPPPTVRLA